MDPTVISPDNGAGSYRDDNTTDEDYEFIKGDGLRRWKLKDKSSAHVVVDLSQYNNNNTSVSNEDATNSLIIRIERDR